MRLVLLLLIVFCIFYAQSQRLETTIQQPNKSKDLSNIKIITFDVFAALMDLYSSLQRNIHAAADAYLSPSQVNALINGWAGFYGILKDIALLAKGKDVHFAHDNLFQVMLETTLNRTLIEIGVSNILPGSARSAILKSWQDLIPWEDTMPVMKALKEKKNPDGTPRFKLATLSNGDDETLAAIVRVFGDIKFDYLLGYSGCGTFKPDPAMYEQVEKLGFAKEEVFHVAGADYDALGAKAHGFTVFWRGPNIQSFFNWSGNKAYNPDYISDDLYKLLEIFE